MTALARPELPPLLKWAGGKRWLLAHLRSIYNGARLVDPFAGGLALPLGLRPEQCLLSDVNPHLMNFYRWVQSGLEWEEGLGIAFTNDRAVYYDNRAKFNALIHNRAFWTKEGALLFYYLNRTCFNGLCRFNRNGYFNVPFGRYNSITYERSFLAYKAALAGWLLYHGDFASLPILPGDFIYADPPYDVEFTQFAPRDFVWADQERLALWLAGHNGPVVASNQATPRILALYHAHGFKIVQVEAPRAISCTGDRTPAVEILAIRGI